MSVRVKCPSCGRSLFLRDAAVGSPSTCPACLAEITVPDTAAAPAAAVQRERQEQPITGLSCPKCAHNVEPVWENCPWCQEPLRGRADWRYGRPDLDVRRDRKSTGVVMIILAVLGFIGVAILFYTALSQLMFTNGGRTDLMVNLVVGLLFLAGLTTLIVFLRSGGHPGASGVRRVVVGTLAMVGGLLVAGLAIFLCIFTVCIAGGGGSFAH